MDQAKGSQLQAKGSQLQVHIEQGSRVIYEALQLGKPCLIGRFGTIELESLLAGTSIQENQTAVLERNAGIFPSTHDSVYKWQEEYTKAIQAADILATGWYQPLARAELNLLEMKLGWSGKQIKLRSLEPYYVDPALRWTTLLANQDVCVVSSFAETAQQQVEKANEIWKGMTPSTLLPAATRWHFVKTGYAPVLAQGRATWMDAVDTDVSCWSEAIAELEKKVLATNASIVLLGCGGLAMILGHRLKEKGKRCLVLGGAIQILFGIKGGRWSTHPVIQAFWNDAWVWPSIDETPRGANEVERACYWKS